MINEDDAILVYSSELPGVNLKKKNKKKGPSEVTIDPKKLTLKLRLEKKGRGGKTVTIIDELPHSPAYFKGLLKELKKLCGTGGSLQKSSIEIQGDCRQKIIPFLEKKGFSLKGKLS